MNEDEPIEHGVSDQRILATRIGSQLIDSPTFA